MAGKTRHQLKCHLRYLLIALCLLVPCTAVWAQEELITHVEVFADDSADLGIDAVSGMEFAPADHTMSLGYTSAAQWLRLRIMPAPDRHEVALIIRPPMLDSVTVYAPTHGQPGSTDPAIFGGAYQAIEPDWPSSLRGYHISPPDGGGDYFVRILSSGSMSFDVMARAQPGAIRISLTTDLVQIHYFAIMLILLLWALWMLSVTKERLFAWFAAMQSVWLFHNLLSFGYATMLMPSVAQDTLPMFYRVVVIATSILSIAFHRAMLIRFQPPVWAVRLLDLQLAATLVAFVLFWTIDRRLALTITAYCIAAAPLVFMANAFAARKPASPGLVTMRVIYTLLSIAMMSWVMTLLGVGAIWVLTLYGFMLHGAVTGVLMVTILHLHGRNLAVAAKEAEARISAIEQQRVIQQERTRTLSQFIAMLSHEARNALSVINLSITGRTLTEQQRARVSGAIDGLSGVIDRCSQSIRLESNSQPTRTEPCDLAEILRRLCEGHLEGDRITLTAPAHAHLHSDPVLLGVVFSNLIDNAVKYSPAGSAVTVVLNCAMDEVCVVVENEHGIHGMPDPERAFEKYYRGAHAKAQIGSGLGLYIVRGLLQLLGGRIAYEPINAHVRFKVWLPC